MIFILIAAGFIAFLYFANKPKNGETIAERDQRMARNIKNSAMGAGVVIGGLALTNRGNGGYDNGYPGGSNGGWDSTYYETPVQQVWERPSYLQNQQPSYIQNQPWFQQPYYATQIPMEYRAAAFQYQSPFAATSAPYNFI